MPAWMETRGLEGQYATSAGTGTSPSCGGSPVGGRPLRSVTRTQSPAFARRYSGLGLAPVFSVAGAVASEVTSDVGAWVRAFGSLLPCFSLLVGFVRSA